MRTVTPEEITVDPEFSARIFPLTDEELSTLKESIAETGIQDGLKVWNRDGDLVLLDGHNRLQIAKETEIISVPVVTVTVTSREEALDWIDRWQLGRRNLTPNQRAILLGRRYNRLKQPHGGQVPGSSGQKSHSFNTAERIGQEHGVDESAVRRAGAFAAAVDTLKATIPDIEQQIINGKGPARKVVVEAARMTDPEAIQAVLKGQTSTPLPSPFRNGASRPVDKVITATWDSMRGLIGGLESIDPAAVKDRESVINNIESTIKALKALRARFKETA
jgi:hypothetical protein